MTASVSSRPDEADSTPATSDPRWTRPALAGLLVATAVSWIATLGKMGWANAFYAAAVQAGTKSWKAFLFGSSDAANSITVDKPPASLWPMELSARIFGVNTWSLLAPQVLLGVASVALLYAIVRRQFGAAAGLIAGAALALTPVATLMFRYDNPDALLALLMVAAVWALMRAVEDGRTRWLVLCGVFVGFGFLTKQMQVMLVVPGLGLTYLIAGPTRLRTRLVQLIAALVSMIAAAGWWVALVTFVPAADRPYVGGSTDNSFLNLTFAYNGLSRLTGGKGGEGGFPMSPGGPGAPGFPQGGHGVPPGGHGFAFGTEAGWARLFTGESGAQISWLLPTALVVLVVGIILRGRASRTDAQRAQYLVWGGWLLGSGIVFSFMSGIYHDYYTVALSPAIAALVGIGVTQLWQHRSIKWVGLTLATTVALTAVWSWVLLSRTADFVPWLRWTVLVVGVVTAALLALQVLRESLSRRVVLAAAMLATAAAVAGPLAYSVQTIATPHTGGIITAGPPVGDQHFPGGPPGFDKTPSDHLVQLLKANGSNYIWAAATNGSNDAANYQLATGDPVMPVGGFMGSDPSPTLAQFRQYVADGKIHYYIVSRGPGDRPPFGDAEGPQAGGAKEQTEGTKIADWVKQNFTAATVDGVTYYDLTAPHTH
ncbi:ArnT family glycosyltransferase [Mycobacterium sp. MAA66]|uniref:ArnT family glycosyltransferase n=1 Tax=Mycobacterium sp. MAA66 TaxID=3156297 RepID=UPI00351822A6